MFSKLLYLKLIGLKDYDLTISNNYYFLTEYYKEKLKENLNKADVEKGFDLFFDRYWFKFYALKYWYDQKEYGKILAYLDHSILTPYVLSNGYYFYFNTFTNFRDFLDDKVKPVFDEILFDSLKYFSLNETLENDLKRILPDGYKYLKELKGKRESKIVRFIMGEE